MRERHREREGGGENILFVPQELEKWEKISEAKHKLLKFVSNWRGNVRVLLDP